MTEYYLTFTQSDGTTLSLDGSDLYAVSDLSFATSQTASFSAGGALSVGKLTFGDLTFTLGSDALSTTLAEILTSGTTLTQVNLYGFDANPNGGSTLVVHNVFKDAIVKALSVVPSTGLQSVTMNFGALVESAAPILPGGTQGTAVTAGWNALTAQTDNSLTTSITGSSLTPPVVNPNGATVTAPVSQANQVFVRIGGETNPLGGGWIPVSASSVAFEQTALLGVTGAGAGKTTLLPLSLTFAPGTLAGTLLQDAGAGTLLGQIDVAVYAPGAASALITDYRFTNVAVADITSDQTSGASSTAQTYTFAYGSEQVGYFNGASAPTVVSGWNALTNTVNKTWTGANPPATLAGIPAVSANVGAVSTLDYYLEISDATGQPLSPDGSTLYEISDFSFSTSQSYNFQGSVTPGKLSENALTFTIGSTALALQLEKDLAAGTSLAQINIYGYPPLANSSTQLVHYIFKLVGIASATDNPDGTFTFTADYSGLVESVAPVNIDGTVGAPVIGGWDAAGNKADTSLTSGVDGSAAALQPTFTFQPPYPGGVSGSETLFVRFVTATGALGGGWINLTSAQFGLLQSYHEASGTLPSGKASAQPLQLSFVAGVLEATLLADAGAGTKIQEIEIAGFNTLGKLIDDVRVFNAVITASDRTADGVGLVNYTFNYADEQSLHNSYSANGAVTSTTQSYNVTTNQPDTTLSYGSDAAPATIATIQADLGAVGIGQSSSTNYYLTFSLANGKTLADDGSPLYQISDLDVSTKASSTLAFSPITFTIASNNLSATLDEILATGGSLGIVHLLGYADNAGTPTQILNDAFKLVGVASDTIDATLGTHSFTLVFGGLVEQTTPLAPAVGEPSVAKAGWNTVANSPDNNLNQTIGSGTPTTITLPTLNPATAVAPAPTTTDDSFYARLIGANGQPLGGGWIKISAATYSLSNNYTVLSTGLQAGNASLAELSLSFAAGSLEPTLLQMEAQGIEISQIDIADYGLNALHQSVLMDDYRFIDAGITGSTHSVTASTPTTTYTFAYTKEQTLSVISGANVTQSYNALSDSISDPFNASDLTTYETSLPLASIASGEGAATANCYAAGTRLKSQRGEIAVEALRVGDRLLTLSGHFKPIVWSGRQRYVCAGHPEPEQVWPVLITAGAFGEGLPVHDLVVSPLHALYADGRLVRAIWLVNGLTIRQTPVTDVDYWHVELPAHDIIYAEGLPAESYLDSGNRQNFEVGAYVAATPNIAAKAWNDTCVPYMNEGAPLAALRKRLLHHAEKLGFAFDSDPELHAIVDGARIEPLHLADNRFAFVFPEGVRSAWLVSRSWRPYDAIPDSADVRTLGLCLSRLEIDGAPLDLAGDFPEGWNEYELTERHRWTTGRARLPAGRRIVILDVCSVGRYPPIQNRKSNSCLFVSPGLEKTNFAVESIGRHDRTHQLRVAVN